MSSEVVARAVRTFLRLDTVGRLIIARELGLQSPVTEGSVRAKFELIQARGVCLESIIRDMEDEL